MLFRLFLAILIGLPTVAHANDRSTYSPATSDKNLPIPGAEHVVIVDIDGCRRDALYQLLVNAPNEVPNMSEIFRGSDWAAGDVPSGQYVGVRRAVTVYPSYTYACQGSFFTGYWPANHGVLGNEYFDREQVSRFGFSGGSIIDPKDVVQVYEYDTFYDAMAPGTGTDWWSGLCDWVTDEIEDPAHRAWGGLANRQLLVPTVYDMASAAGLSSLITFNMYSSVDFRDDPNITWIKPTPEDFCTYELGNAWDYDAAMADAFVGALREADEAPDLMTVYFAGHDHYAHGFDRSPDGESKAQPWYLSTHVDRILGVIMDELKAQGIYDQTVFLFSTDHGHTNVQASDYHSIVMEDELEESVEDFECGFLGEPCFDVMDYWDWFWGDDYSAYVALNSGAAHIYLRNRTTDNWLDYPATSDMMYVASHLARFSYGALNSNNLMGSHEESPELQGQRSETTPYPSQRVELILVRDSAACDAGWRTPYGVFQGVDEPLVDLEVWLAENPEYYLYVDPITRIENMNSVRSGDVIFVPAQNEYDRTETFYADGPIESTHGSLYPGDSYIPFVLGGVPLTGVSDIVASAYLVDASPTVAHILGFEREQMDGSSILE